MNVRRITSAIVTVCACGCVESFDPPVVDQSPAMVVDALLSDAPGPHTVRLFLSSPIDDDLQEPAVIPGANVSIVDENGVIEVLHEETPGVYHSSNGYSGVIGHRYKLVIVTAGGEVVASEFIEMKPAGEIVNVYYEYVSGILNPDNPDLPHDAVNLFLDARSSDDGAGMLRWRWQGTYQTHTRPELRTARDPDGNIIPWPYPCSGYVVDDRGQLRSIDVCVCCDCWPTEYSRSAIVSSSQTVGNVYHRVFLGQLPVDQWRFHKKYHLVVDQLSVNDDVHSFWALVQAQQQGSTNIFQPNVVKVKGNLQGTFGGRTVFGIFSVSAISQSTIEIKQDDIPIPPYEPDIIIQDCRYFIENSSNVQPPFW